MTEPTIVHPGLRAFIARRGIAADALRSDGRLTLTIDGRFRVQIRPAPAGGIALQAKVMTLAADERAADAAIARLLALGAGMLREHASTLCLESPGESLQLQQVVAADASGEQLEAEIGEFTNALDFWVRTGKSL